jgi:probable HAF family extracellular repeat protein
VWNNIAPSPSAYNSIALGINNSGTVIGNGGFQTSQGSLSGKFLQSGGSTWLGYNYTTSSYFEGINQQNQVVGYGGVGNGSQAHAMIWSFNGANLQSTINLGVPTGCIDSFGLSINNNGQVVGYAHGLNDTTASAMLWNGNTWINIGSLLSGNSEANSINNNGEVVGVSYGDGNVNFRAFLYANGSMNDLNNLIIPSSGWTLEDATAINDSGDIIGYGLNSQGQQDSFLLTPETVPEPTTLGLLSVGLASLFVLQKRLPKRV